MTVSIHTLEKGVIYVVTKPFSDYYSNEFTKGETLTFVQRNFSPYQGGYTIVFKEKTLYLQEDINRDIIDSFDNYLQLHDATGRVSMPAPPVKKKNKKLEDFSYFLLCTLFVAAGAWVVFFSDEKRIKFIVGGWVGMAFFGLGALVFLGAMFKRSDQ